MDQESVVVGCRYQGTWRCLNPVPGRRGVLGARLLANATSKPAAEPTKNGTLLCLELVDLLCGKIPVGRCHLLTPQCSSQPPGNAIETGCASFQLAVSALLRWRQPGMAELEAA
jgi:hypothetical protein